MSIDAVVPLVERIVTEDPGEVGIVFFSHRDWESVHRLGLNHDFAVGAPWARVSLGIMIRGSASPAISVRILWSREKLDPAKKKKLELPTKECAQWTFPVSAEGARALAQVWPGIRRQFAQAIARGRPPEKKARSGRELWGEEFISAPFTITHQGGLLQHGHDVVACIRPHGDAASTLTYAWAVMRELARWTCEEFKERPREETYRVVVAWSRQVRPLQGHILKVWLNRKELAEVAGFLDPAACAAHLGGDAWLPLANWQKDVFSGANPETPC